MYTYLQFAEGLGGLAVLVLAVAKCLAGTIERRLLESDLISNFYQVEK
jgi:hypothetical protein